MTNARRLWFWTIVLHVVDGPLTFLLSFLDLLMILLERVSTNLWVMRNNYIRWVRIRAGATLPSETPEAIAAQKLVEEKETYKLRIIK